MARVKRAVGSKKHRKQVLERAKGYYGNKSRSVRAANEQVMKSGQYAFRDRRAKKGEGKAQEKPPPATDSPSRLDQPFPSAEALRRSGAPPPS